MSKTIYTHKHHIIPRHAGGSDDPSNIVELTIEEHALAHKKLFFIYSRWQDEVAYLTLSGQISKAEAIKRAIVEANLGRKDTEETRRKKSEAQKRIGNRPPSMLGKKMSEEQKRKIGLKSKGRKHTEETKRKIAQANKDRPPISEETKKKMSKAQTGRKHPTDTIKKMRIAASIREEKKRNARIQS